MVVVVSGGQWHTHAHHKKCTNLLVEGVGFFGGEGLCIVVYTAAVLATLRRVVLLAGLKL